MRRGLFDVFAGISLILTLVLALGYTTSFGPSWTGMRGSGASVQIRIDSLRVDRGRIVLLLEPWQPPGLGVNPLGFRWRGHLLPWRSPDMRRSIWEFDAHRPLGPGSFILACPIWCVAAPLLIAPWCWWRSRRNRQSPAGFEVLSGEPTQTSLSLHEG
jgi:hypothetical protein